MSVPLSDDLQNCDAFTVGFNFSARSDTQLFSLFGDHHNWTVALNDGALAITGCGYDRIVAVDIEDSADLRDQQWHSLAIRACQAGSEIFLDGYQIFSTTADLSPAAMQEHCSYRFTDDLAATIRDVYILPHILEAQQITAVAIRPEPRFRFAADYLCDYDLAQLRTIHTGTISLRFRLRGQGQLGTIMAAGNDDGEQMRITVDASHIAYLLKSGDGYWHQFSAAGSWDDGHWVDLVIRSSRGAVDIYVNGFLESHTPGQVFFADLDQITSLVIGRNTKKEKLFGEVKDAAIYDFALTEGQIKQLSHLKHYPTRCLFDQGYEGSLSYRIPSLVKTSNGVIIAGADQREVIPNDAPNSINFVIRRSFDGGQSWEPLRKILSYPGQGALGASVIDSCLVYDEQIHRVIAIVDHFPGGVGQPNCEQINGVDPDGRFWLFDAENRRYRWRSDGVVVDSDGHETSYQVEPNGDVYRDGKHRGNIFHARQISADDSLWTARTSYLQMIYSDDDGASWSEPVNLDYELKADWMSFLGTGPGNGIQLKNSEHAGRLIIPVYYNNSSWLSLSAGVIYSDDHGRSWHRGASVNDGRSHEGKILDAQSCDDPQLSSYESAVVERADGAVVIYMRNQHPSAKVARAISYDAGQSWSDYEYVEQIDEIFSQPCAMAFPDSRCDDRIIFANASQLMPYRGRGVLRLSEDGGRSWKKSRTFNSGHYVYQSMVALDDGRFGLLWEREMSGLYFTILDLDWFDDHSTTLI